MRAEADYVIMRKSDLEAKLLKRYKKGQAMMRDAIEKRVSAALGPLVWTLGRRGLERLREAVLFDTDATPGKRRSVARVGNFPMRFARVPNMREQMVACTKSRGRLSTP